MNEFYAATKKGSTGANYFLKLSVTGSGQDWEIEFADPQKLPEILDLLKIHVLAPEVVDALATLLIASFDQAKDEGMLDLSVVARAKEWFSKNLEPKEKMFFFWIRWKQAFHPELVKEILGTMADGADRQ